MLFHLCILSLLSIAIFSASCAFAGESARSNFRQSVSLENRRRLLPSSILGVSVPNPAREAREQRLNTVRTRRNGGTDDDAVEVPFGQNAMDLSFEGGSIFGGSSDTGRSTGRARAGQDERRSQNRNAANRQRNAATGASERLSGGVTADMSAEDMFDLLTGANEDDDVVTPSGTLPSGRTDRRAGQRKTAEDRRRERVERADANRRRTADRRSAPEGDSAGRLPGTQARNSQALVFGEISPSSDLWDVPQLSSDTGRNRDAVRETEGISRRPRRRRRDRENSAAESSELSSTSSLSSAPGVDFDSFDDSFETRDQEFGPDTSGFRRRALQQASGVAGVADGQNFKVAGSTVAATAATVSDVGSASDIFDFDEDFVVAETEEEALRMAREAASEPSLFSDDDFAFDPIDFADDDDDDDDLFGLDGDGDSRAATGPRRRLQEELTVKPSEIDLASVLEFVRTKKGEAAIIEFLERLGRTVTPEEVQSTLEEPEVLDRIYTALQFPQIRRRLAEMMSEAGFNPAKPAEATA